MRNTVTQSGKGFKLQTLRAIDTFFEAIIQNGRKSKIFIATEKIGDVYCQVDNKINVEEVKNYSSPHSINSEEIKNSVINFIDIFIKFKSQEISFSFYSTAGKSIKDNKNLEHSILYYLENNIYTDIILEKVKETIIPYYKTKNKKDTGFINEINSFSNDDWRTFLSNITWQFDLLGNQEISEVLKDKCRDAISQIEPSFLTYNGIETSVIYEFREQLEKKLEENQYLSDLEFKDFENIVLNEYKIRTLKVSRDYGKFKRIEDHRFNIEPKYFYFTNYEQQLIEEITNQFLHSNNRNLILLTGKSAQGKTILSRQIATELSKHQYLTLFLEINSKTNYQDLNLAKISSENSLIFCLITRSHLNLELINEILYNQEKYNNIKFIFESRIIDKTLEQEAKELVSNEILVVKKLDFQNHEVFKEKYLGILRKHTLSEIDINQLIKATGRNFLFLSEYLGRINISSLSKINYSRINELVLEKYEHRKYDSLKEFAIINQYEIPIKYDSLSDKTNFSDLVRENELLCIDFNQDYYNLYHSDFAKLIAESFFNGKGFNSYQILEYEVRIFLKYLTNTDFNELQTIFQSLYSNSVYKLLKKLLTNPSLKVKIFSHYSNPDNFTFLQSSSKPLRELLRIIPEVCPEVFPDYLEAIIINNDRLKDFFTNDSSFIFTIIKISTSIDKYLPTHFDEFNEKLPQYFLNTSDDIPFSAITYYFNEAKKNNSPLLTILRDKFPLESLKRIANNEEFLNLTEGLVQLYKLGGFEGFVECIKSELINKSKKTTLNRFSKGLQNINRISSIQFATAIFEKYPNELLLNQLRNIDIKTALKTVNILKEFGYNKIYKNFQLNKFNNGFKQFNYIEISDILLEADKFLDNKKLSHELITNIEVDLLIEKIQKSNPYYVAQSFHLLSKRRGFKEYIEKIYYLIPASFFKYPTEYTEFFKIIETLHFLKLIDKSGEQTNKCLKFNQEIIDKFNYDSLPFERLILIFTYLKEINLEKTKTLVERSHDIIRKKIKTNEYKEIGITLSRLANISPTYSLDLLHEIVLTNNFFEFLKTQKINVTSRTLKEMHNVENISNLGLVNELYLKLKKETIITSIENVKFDVICHSLNELLSIELSDYKRTRKLVREIGIDSFKNSMKNTSFIAMCIGFISLFNINRKFATELFYQSREVINGLASISELNQLSDGLKALASLNPSFANDIFNSSNINLKELALESNNYSLYQIKKCLYYLKSIDKKRTVVLLKWFNSQSLSYKFNKEKQFDKATELLSQLYLIDSTKIEQVVKELDKKAIYNKCKGLEVQIISKGLNEIAKIDRQVANEVLIQVFEDKEILKKLSALQFDVFGKVLREVSKIELKPVLSKNILSHVSSIDTATKATKMSTKQLSLGFGALKQVDMIFSIEVAKKLILLKPNLKKSLSKITNLIN